MSGYELLSAKTFKNERDAIEKISEYLQDNKLLEIGTHIKVSIVFATGRRTGKTSNEYILDMLTDCTGTYLYETDSFTFDFLNRDYVIQGSAVYLTASEQLLLYQALILKIPVTDIVRYKQTLHRLKEKFGCVFVDAIYVQNR